MLDRLRGYGSKSEAREAVEQYVDFRPGLMTHEIVDALTPEFLPKRVEKSLSYLVRKQELVTIEAPQADWDETIVWYYPNRRPQ